MSESKIYRITGQIDKPFLFEPIIFKKDISAVKESHALEKIYSQMGSSHRAKRHQIKIHKVEVLEES